MKTNKHTAYIVNEEILPEAIKKTVEAKKLLKNGDVKTINEAVKKVNISRSAFYKYKDHIVPFSEIDTRKIITLLLLLEHKAGVLSNVLNTIAAATGNILTINQGIPMQGLANASVSIETSHMKNTIEDLIVLIEEIDGVKKTDLVTQY